MKTLNLPRLPFTVSRLPFTAALIALTAALPACGPSEGGGGSVQVQISGEELATDGFRFPDGSEVALTDGWELTFTHVLVSVDRAWLAEDPNLDPFDQSRTGDLVAEAKGPWLIDLHQEGSAPGAGGEGTAIPIALLDTAADGASLPVGESYAFSYSTTPATAASEPLNLPDDAETATLKDEMIAGKYTIYYVGTATFKGTSCDTSDPAYDFTALPQTVNFKLGFTTPVDYLNCQNQENQGDPLSGENYPRGVILREGTPTLAQMTLHLDHPFYSAVTHEPRLYFDQLAAQLKGQPEGTPLTLSTMTGVDPSAFTDADSTPLPWRSCDGSPLPAGAQRAFDTATVPLDPSAAPAEALRDYRDYMHYVQSTQGHMNGGEGLCFTRRNYPSPD
ncbi:MAG: hypothetical protein R3F14_14485 [Polyangiaceae bacterium]